MVLSSNLREIIKVSGNDARDDQEEHGDDTDGGHQQEQNERGQELPEAIEIGFKGWGLATVQLHHGAVESEGQGS